MSNIVDISYAVSPEEAQGRKRMKNLETGEMFWAVSEKGDYPTIPGYDVLEVFSRVSEPVMLSKEQVTPLEDHVVIKPKGKKHGA